MWLILAGLFGSVAFAQSDVQGLEKTLQEVGSRFPQTITGDALYRAALVGVAEHLGAQLGVSENQVMTAAEHRDTAAWLDGRRYGIGTEFSVVAGRGMALTSVFPGGPADAAGLKVGDLLVSIDNHPFTGLPAPVIQARIQRQKTEHLVFDVRHEDGTVSRVPVSRGEFSVPTVSVRRDRDALVVRILFFGSGAAAEVKRALSQWSGAAVVLDLRDNPGGSLDEMVATADLFLDPDAVVVETSHGGEEHYTLYGTEPAAWTGSMIVLVNQGTSEAAEAFVAALQDHGRARVVGTRSAGRGIRDSYYPAGRDLVLKIADTFLKSPSGRSWHSNGIRPDVFVQSQQITLPALGRPSPPDLQRDAAIQLISVGEDDR